MVHSKRICPVHIAKKIKLNKIKISFICHYFNIYKTKTLPSNSYKLVTNYNDLSYFNKRKHLKIPVLLPTKEITADRNCITIVYLNTRPRMSYGFQIIACDKVNTCRIPKGTSHIKLVTAINAMFQATPIDIFSFHAFAGTIKIIHRSVLCPQYLSLEQMSTCKTIY